MRREFELEITESLLLSSGSEVAVVLENIRNLGIRLAIDDFGSGYCSFSYLSEFGFSKLKVDGRFVKSMAANPRDAAITTAIVGLGKVLNMTVIAECVETNEQLQILRTCGCDEIQGYLSSRPLDVRAFSEKLRSKRDRAASTIGRTGTHALEVDYAGVH